MICAAARQSDIPVSGQAGFRYTGPGAMRPCAAKRNLYRGGGAPLREPSGRVCLDPGHDAGNLANRSPDGTYYEQEFTLDLGKRLEKLLTDRGVAVTMTRTGGEAVSLAKRCEIANSIPDLDLFVSLHSNAAAGSGWSSAKGWSIYLYGPGGRREQAAQDILEQVRAAGITVRSTPIVYAPELYVLKHTKAPAVLIENGFHTNQDEVSLLKEAAYRQKLAVAEARGILEYLGIPWTEDETDPGYKAEVQAAVAWLTENGVLRGKQPGGPDAGSAPDPPAVRGAGIPDRQAGGICLSQRAPYDGTGPVFCQKRQISIFFALFYRTRRFLRVQYLEIPVKSSIEGGFAMKKKQKKKRSPGGDRLSHRAGTGGTQPGKGSRADRHLCADTSML